MLPGHLAAAVTMLEQQRQAQMRWQGQTGGFGPLEAMGQLVKPDLALGTVRAELGGVDIPGAGLWNSNQTARQSTLKKRKFDRMHGTKVSVAACCQ